MASGSFRPPDQTAEPPRPILTPLLPGCWFGSYGRRRERRNASSVREGLRSAAAAREGRQIASRSSSAAVAAARAPQRCASAARAPGLPRCATPAPSRPRSSPSSQLAGGEARRRRRAAAQQAWPNCSGTVRLEGHRQLPSDTSSSGASAVSSQSTQSSATKARLPLPRSIQPNKTAIPGSTSDKKAATGPTGKGGGGGDIRLSPLAPAASSSSHRRAKYISIFPAGLRRLRPDGRRPRSRGAHSRGFAAGARVFGASPRRAPSPDADQKTTGDSARGPDSKFFFF